MKFKHTIVTFTNPTVAAEVSILKDHGDNGWELVSVVSKKKTTTFYFKKEIKDGE